MTTTIAPAADDSVWVAPPAARRDYLLDAIRAYGRPVTTALAVDLMDGSPWPTTGRHTTQRDLRRLAARGQLTAVDIDKHRRIYHLTTGEEDRA